MRALLALVFLGLGVAAGLALLAGALWTPAEIAAGAPLAGLGLEPRACPGCPLCGLSRGFALLPRGGLGEALALNPLVALAYPLACALLAATPFAARALWRSWRLEQCAS